MLADTVAIVVLLHEHPVARAATANTRLHRNLRESRINVSDSIFGQENFVMTASSLRLNAINQRLIDIREALDRVPIEGERERV